MKVRMIHSVGEHVAGTEVELEDKEADRFIVLGPALVLNLPWVALWVLAILANVTAIQRALYVRRQALQRASTNNP